MVRVFGIATLILLFLTGCTGLIAPEGTTRAETSLESSENSTGKRRRKKDDDQPSTTEPAENNNNDDNDDDDESDNTPDDPIALLNEAPYDAKIDDQIEVKTKSKSWASGDDEPDDWDSESSREVKVIRLYNDVCDFVSSYEGAGGTTVETHYPSQCNVPAFACGEAAEVKTKQECRYEELDPADVGDFTDAVGRKSICVSITEADNGDKTVTQSTTEAWYHKDKLKINGTAEVRSNSFSCTIIIDDETDPKSLDPCTTDKFDITFSKTEQEIPSQDLGDGTDKVDLPTAKMTMAGDRVIPDKVGTIAASCIGFDLQGEYQLNVSVTQPLCYGEGEDEEPGTASLNLPSLTATGADLAVTSAQFNAKSDADTETPGLTSAECTVTLDKDEDTGLLSGTAECPGDFTAAVGNDTAQVTEIEFSCFAPAGLDLSTF